MCFCEEDPKLRAVRRNRLSSSRPYLFSVSFSFPRISLPVPFCARLGRSLSIPLHHCHPKHIPYSFLHQLHDTVHYCLYTLPLAILQKECDPWHVPDVQ